MKIFNKALLLTILFFSASCATNISKPAADNSASKVKFGEFSSVEIKPVTLSEKYSKHTANQKAAKKVDELLVRDLKVVFPNLRRLGEGEDFSKSSSKILQITPVIKEVKFIGVGARVMVGGMAGDSAILMQVEYKNSKTGEVIANPEFYSKASGFVGSLTFGAHDNTMLNRVVTSAVKYSSDNK